ncbi:MAG: alkaline phosphatase [Thermoanaerobaculales bacterium]|nr:alkaline phosphatase [Thermoanaerobaculales bacterium]
MASRPGDFLIHALIVVGLLAAALVVFSMFGGAEIAIGNVVLRAQGGVSYALAPPSASALEAAPFEITEHEVLGGLPKNVIVILGDGMGIGMVSAASQLLSPPGVPMRVESAPVVGLMHTWAANILATDSAAAATSMATGYKTDKGILGLLPDGRAVRTLFEAARDAGFATAVVTTSGLADATPGGFLTHVSSRDDYDHIFSQQLDSGTEILVGGDWSANPKASRRAPYRELIENVEALGAERGYTVIRDWKEIEKANPPMLVILPPRPEMPLQHGPPLAETTALVLDHLERSGDRFIALLETEVTDEAGHSNDMTQTLNGMREYEDTVALVLDRVISRNDTLVLLLGDHETGGPHLLEGEYDDGQVVVRWAHESHSSQLVPVFAFGPGSTAFSGVFDNTQFGVRIARLLDLENFPQLADSQQN